MKNLSKFDLGMIIAFVVVALLGGGAWWYFSDQLQTAQGDVTAAKADFDLNSTKENLVVSPSNKAALQANIDLLRAQLGTLIQAKLQSDKNKLSSVDKEDPVAWKHDLDAEVHQLRAAANLKGVTLPDNFYFSFSRYLSENPNDEQTIVLGKQLLGVEEIANILISAPVKSIIDIRRTYEEDPHSSSSADGGPGGMMESGQLAGYAINAGGGVYTAYPFEIDFETTTENLRSVVDNLLQSPYVFIIRTLTVQNSQPGSPQISDLDKIAGTSTTSVVDSSPGAVGASSVKVAPVYLFGNATLHVTIRVDLIEWTATP